MHEGLFVMFIVSLATLMTVAHRHRDLAPVLLGLVVKLGVFVGLAIPAYLLLYSPDGAGQSSPSGVSNDLSLVEALTMISYMILGPLGLSAFFVQVRKTQAQGEVV